MMRTLLLQAPSYDDRFSLQTRRGIRSFSSRVWIAQAAAKC
jgi:hypothetical protein